MTIFFASINACTKNFFNLHWPRDKWGSPPVWSSPWYFQNSMVGGNKQGVYTLLSRGDSVLYIGVGASLGGGIYEGHGLNARTGKYTRLAPDQKKVPVPERKYVPSGNWKERGLEAIRIIGFEPEQAYLAYALEAYLLSVIHPPYNKIRATRTSN